MSDSSPPRERFRVPLEVAGAETPEGFGREVSAPWHGEPPPESKETDR